MGIAALNPSHALAFTLKFSTIIHAIFEMASRPEAR
jgi:hypothetical protein